MVGQTRPTENGEVGAWTILFGRKDPLRPMYSNLSLTTTYIREVQVR